MENSDSNTYFAALAKQYGFSLTVKNMAEILQVGDDVVYRLINTKQLPATTIGRQKRTDTKTFATWLTGRVKRAA